MKYFPVMEGADGIVYTTGKTSRAVAVHQVGAWCKSIGRAAVVPSTRRSRRAARRQDRTVLRALLNEFEVTP